ncbi:hypothetical protein CSA56_00460 [candidate division KSB3 bacterium]|uniref:Uncharacterized protein n=1 Tax=candidate division KSB3 bacterium TaxID=2044937 RepID=A0A2G6KL16_9BACT|nr:MAG: hypothetical protein CSA56_00460 [candidate division KSB3 bacterium]
MMKKIWFAWIVVILTFQLSGTEFVHASGGFTQQSEQLVEELHKYFPQVSGTIVSVRDEKLFVDIGNSEPIIVGAQLALLDEGIEIVDPKTKKVLGRYEEQIGTIQILEIMEQFSVAKVLWTKPGTEAIQGNHVGGFSGKVKVAVLPILNLTEETVQTNLAYDLFVRTMASDERFAVFDEADLKSAAVKAGVSPSDMTQKEALADINDVLKAHTFLQLTLRPDAGNILVQALLLSDSGENIGSAQEIVREYADLQPRTRSEKQPAISQTESAPQSQPFSEKPSTVSHTATEQEAIWMSEILKKRAHKIASGDLTGNGKTEVVLATRTDLELFEHAALGEKDSLRPLNKIEGFNDAFILALGIADMNGNGREEIFMTTLRSITAETRVFEYRSGTFEEIWRTKGTALRVLRSPKGKKFLVGQSTTASVTLGFLSGKVAEYAWDGNDYTRRKALNIPGRVKLFGFTLADLDQNTPNATLYFDKYNRINVFQGGERIERTGSYEGYWIPVEREGEDEKNVLRIAGNIELTTLGPEQQVHLVVFENLSPFKFIQGLPLYSGSRICVLKWTGTEFTQTFQSEEADGYIVDYTVADVDNDGQQEAVLAKVLKSDDLFRTPESQIMVYELE